MATYDNTHSRIVAWLKILLPLAALAILSTLFMFSRSIEPSDAIPYAEVDVEELAREPRLSAPEYSGVTSDGAAVTVSAAMARPDSENSERITADGLSAVLETPGGLRAELSADEGSLDTAGKVLTLGGGVTLSASTGYTVTTDSLRSSLDRTEITSDGAVNATAPFGSIEAGGMTLEHEGVDGEAYVLVFKNGVKLVYDPDI